MNKMTRVLTVFMLVFSSVLHAEKGNKALYNETYRPQYHFSTEINRMGNPITLIQIDSVYHLYYQYNPFNLNSGFVNWGHATSPDLLHWKNQELALKQPEQVSDSMNQSPWWGSVVETNSELKAVYNRWGLGVFSSTSKTGSNWQNETPLILPAENSHCEPFVFKYEKTNMWVMLSFNADSSTISIYNSADLVNWKKTSEMKSDDGFPQLVELAVDRKLDKKKWVLITGRSLFQIGDFDGKAFKPQTDWQMLDHGRKIDGSICYNDIKKQRVIMTSNLRSAQFADLPSNGQLTFFNEISLRDLPEEGITLFRNPMSEIASLYDKTSSWEAKKIYPGLNNNLLSGVRGSELRIKCTIDLKNCDKVGFFVRKNKVTAGADINYIPSQKLFTAFETNITVEPIDNKIELDILIDRSSVEIFINQGKYVLSSPFVPDYESMRYELYTVGGEILVEKMEVHTLKSIWKQ